MSCESGKFSDATVATECQLCPDHSFSGFGANSTLNPEVSVGQCICDTHYWLQESSTDGKYSCVECPSNMDANPLLFPSECNCKAGWQLMGEVCETCPIGKYKGNVSSDSCEACPIGTYTDYAGSTVCSGCALGKIYNYDAFSCDQCPRGKHRADSTLAECSVCPPGTFSNVYGAVTCTKCEAGKYLGLGIDTSDSELLPDGLTEQTSCQTCPDNMDSGVGQGSCDCNPGLYRDLDGVCVSCPDYETSSRGAQSSIDCYCIAGYQQLMEDCEKCSAGKFSVGEKDGFCGDCEIGTYTNEAGSSTCTACEPGKFGLSWGMDGNSQQFPGETAASECHPCPSDATSPQRSISRSQCSCAQNAYPFSGESDSGKFKKCMLCPANSRAHTQGGCILNHDIMSLDFWAGADIQDNNAVKCCACDEGYEAIDEQGAMTCSEKSCCGDGIRTGSEECDDYNTYGNDGCSAECTVEKGYVCTLNSTLQYDTCKCGANFYLRVSADGSILSCEAGYLCISPDACSCGANFYRDFDPNHGLVCRACPKQSTSPEGSLSVEACKCEANFYLRVSVDWSAATCATCPENVLSSAGGTSCDCPSGQSWNAVDGNCDTGGGGGSGMDTGETDGGSGMDMGETDSGSGMDTGETDGGSGTDTSGPDMGFRRAGMGVGFHLPSGDFTAWIEDQRDDSVTRYLVLRLSEVP